MSNTANSQFVYVTYIRTTPERLWEALTSPEFTKQYWFGSVHKCDWKVGSPWTLIHGDGQVTDAGEVLEVDRPKRLVLKWHHEWMPQFKSEGWSRCEIVLEPVDQAVKLTITHVADKPGVKYITEGVANGWPRILSNLKSLLENGAVAVGAWGSSPKATPQAAKA